MASFPTRLSLGFLAGSLSYLLFQGAFGSALYVAQVIPSLPWSLAPVPPFDLPKSLSLGFWAGLWGVAYALLEPRLTARLGWVLGGLVFGLAPLSVYWLVVLPLKNLGIGGGFHSSMMLIELGFHAVFGIGLAILLRTGFVLIRRKLRTSPRPLFTLEGKAK